jgi:hypothetical protein
MNESGNTEFCRLIVHNLKERRKDKVSVYHIHILISEFTHVSEKKVLLLLLGCTEGGWSRCLLRLSQYRHRVVALSRRPAPI